MTGPLEDIRIVEFAGIGPVPFAATMLADMGADVIRIERPASADDGPDRADASKSILNRGRRSIVIDLKQPAGQHLAMELVGRADALIEGHRPGVMERLGLGPEDCLAVNRALVYGRSSGWGQDGPYRLRAGHDINYIAISGALSLIGHADGPPVPPVAMVGDYGGGAMFLLTGILAALLEARTSGQGQVVDCAIVEGAAMLTSSIHARRAEGHWLDGRGINKNDTGSHFYNVYRCKDGEYVSIGALEPQFYKELLRCTGLSDDPEFAGQWDQSKWPAADPAVRAKADRHQWPKLKLRFDDIFATKTREEWCEVFAGVETCFAPVLSLAESTGDPHLLERSMFIEIDGVTQPAPTPRFSRTASAVARPPATPGQHTDDVLRGLALDADTIASLREAEVVR
jgi:alpha-methylacyl-CoA racemase